MNGLSPTEILYVDNDPESCEWVKNSFLTTENDFEVVCITGAVDALDRLRRQAFDLIVLEYCLTEMTGPELCSKIRRTDTDTPVVIYSALYRDIDRKKAMDAGANAFVVKSDGFSNLTATIRRLLTPRSTISRHYHPIRRSSSIF